MDKLSSKESNENKIKKWRFYLVKDCQIKY